MLKEQNWSVNPIETLYERYYNHLKLKTKSKVSFMTHIITCMNTSVSSCHFCWVSYCYILFLLFPSSVKKWKRLLHPVGGKSGGWEMDFLLTVTKILLGYEESLCFKTSSVWLLYFKKLFLFLWPPCSAEKWNKPFLALQHPVNPCLSLVCIVVNNRNLLQRSSLSLF